jgi:hypothetical protein
MEISHLFFEQARFALQVVQWQYTLTVSLVVQECEEYVQCIQLCDVLVDSLV